MMQVGTNQSTTYHSQPSLSTAGGQTGRSSSTSRQQQQSQYDNEQLANIRPRLCTLRKWPHYDGYGVHLARNQHWLGLRIGDVEPNSPAESGGLLREDVVLAVNGHPVENDDFFVILSFIQHELEDNQIRFLVLDPHSADLARRNHINIDENFRTCVRMETPTLTVSPEKLLYDQWRTTNTIDPTAAQNIIHLGPTPSLNQNQPNAQRYQQGPSTDGRDDVYTFLPYSDHAIENGKSFFDILFEQENNPSSIQQQSTGNTIQYSPRNEYTGDNELDDNKDKNIGSQIKDGVKNLVKSGFENIKSVLPSKSRDNKEKSDSIDSKYKTSSDPIDNTSNRPESPTLVDQIKNKFKQSTGPTNIPQQGKESQPYERLWHSSSQQEDTNNNLRSEPRMCSLTLRPGVDTIGISLHPDKDFGHIIKQVEPNSPADRSGIEQGDCIVSLNAIPLLNIPYEDVLSNLKQSRHEPHLDFLVAKKSYLLKSRQKNATLATKQQDPSGRYKDSTTNTAAEVMPSSNIIDRNTSSVPPSQALEQLYNKYNDEQNEQITSYRPKETVSTTTTNEQYDQRLPPFDDDRYASKQQQQGQIMQGVGPATADRSSWGVSSGKSTDDFPAPISGDSSVRSTSRTRRQDTDETKGRSSSLEDSFKPLQVGITNPTPVQQSGNISPTIPIDDGQRTSRPISSSVQQDSSPKALPSPDTAATSTHVDTTALPPSKQNQTIQNLPYAVPIVPTQTTATTHDYEQESIQTIPSTQSDLRLATMPLSELKNHDYELHNIQLMQPTETSPVGLKLTKQQDPLQYIITAVAKGTKADLAGLKVNDWLIKIEGNDIRTVEFAEVSQDIRQLLTNAGLINMVVARKKTPTSSPITKQLDKQQITPSSSRSESLNRPQAAQGATSLLTTDITRDTPDNSQVRFIPDRSISPSTTRSQRSPIPTHETIANVVPGGPLSVGLTNPIPDEKGTRSPRSQSHSPTREYTVNPQQKTLVTDQPFEEYDPNEIRHVVLKEALGLDFNSFIPEGDSQVQTHFISNVQQSSMADKAGLRDGDRILTVNGVDVTNSVHEDVRRMMQSKKPLQLTVVNDPKYLELIENVKRNQAKVEGTRDRTNSPPPDYETLEQEKSGGFSDSSRTRPPLKSSGSDSGSESNIHRSKDDSSKSDQENLSKYLQNLFTDDSGTVQIKHCILKKDPTYNGYGLLLRYQSGLHLIDQVEEDSPAYTAGLREDDVILFVDKKNVEQMTHDDVKNLIRKLSQSNTNIDLILIKKSDIQRYKAYPEQNSINWDAIFQNKLSKETIQTEPQPQPQQASVSRSSNDQTNNPRTSSTSSSGKQPAPAPPTASSKIPSPGTRICILQPSAERTAGFALSGKTPAPFIICQIEKNSPADKAGLLINDALLSINGKSVTDKTYEETVKLIKEALQQKSVELVVRDSTSSSAAASQLQPKDRLKIDSQSSTSDQGKISMASNDSNNLGNTDSMGGGEPSRQGSNAVEEYQKQRNKELSYTLRLCHLHPTNGDGTQAATFGFELGEDSGYEYPLILNVEPQSPAEGAGLQSRDILLKINERKTKGLGYEKVKKEIEKAKRDGRLEMLVVDQETFDYCKRTKKPLKEPEMKVKHVFPKSRSLASIHKLPIAAVAAATASRESHEHFDESLPSYSHTSIGNRLSTPKETDSENEDDNQKSAPTTVSSQPTTTHYAPSAVNFDLSPPNPKPANASMRSNESPLKFFDPAQTASQSTAASSAGNPNVPQTARSTPALNQTSTRESKGSKTKGIPNAIHSLFHKISHPKSSKRS